MKGLIKNNFVLEPFRGQKATLCQMVSQSDSKWPRKTRTHTQTHFRIYISRDISRFIEGRVFFVPHTNYFTDLESGPI